MLKLLVYVVLSGSFSLILSNSNSWSNRQSTRGVQMPKASSQQPSQNVGLQMAYVQALKDALSLWGQNYPNRSFYQVVGHREMSNREGTKGQKQTNELISNRMLPLQEGMVACHSHQLSSAGPEGQGDESPWLPMEIEFKIPFPRAMMLVSPIHHFCLLGLWVAFFFSIHQIFNGLYFITQQCFSCYFHRKSSGGWPLITF